MNPFDKYNNQADVVNLDKWLAQQQATHAAKTQTKPKKQSGNFLTHLLPTIGGTGGGVAGGAVGGAVAGSAILPGVGTVAGGLIGALLGGSAGGAAGKVAENKIEGKGLTSGVGGEALQQGVLSAGPLRLAKVATGTIKGAKAATSLTDAITQAAEKTAKPTAGLTAKNLVTQGQQAQGRVAGVSAGTKVAGKELTPQDTKKMLDTLKGEGIKTGNANNTFRDLQDKLTQYGKQINTHFSTNNTPLAPKDTKAIAGDFIKNLKTSDPTMLKQANILATDLKNNVSDTKSLWQFRKSLDGKIPDAKFGTDEATTAKVAAMKAMRQHITQQLGDVPGASNYHALAEVKPFVSAEAKRLNNPGGGIVGRIAASGPVQKGESVLGKATENAGNALGGGIPSNPFSLGNVAKRTAPLGSLEAALGSLSEQNTNSNADGGASTSANSSGLSVPDLNTPADTSLSQGSASPYSQENMMADIARDPKHADDYISTYQSLDKIFNPPAAKNTGIIKPTGQQYGLATGGYNALQQLAQLIGQNPSVVDRNATPGQGLPLVGSLITNASGAGDYHALSDNVLQSLIHLQTGATATPEEIKAAKGQLPQPGDSAEIQQRKLNNLTAMFAPYIQGGQLGSSSSDPTDLVSALMASGYGQ